MLHTTKDFYREFTENRHILPYYIKLDSNYNTKTFYSLEGATPISNIKCVSIKLFPKYLSPHFYTGASIALKKVFQKDVNGCAIHIKEKTTIDLFLRKEYSKKFRTSINRSVNRFELCFNYSYNMITEDISAEKYRFLMDALHKMLEYRFNHRNEPNDVLTNWNYYYTLIYKLINIKKASMFVVYNNDEPVNICINYHFKNILFISISSFNHNFSKFSLGNISIYKIIEWAMDHNFEFLDMGYGDLQYKRFWSNYLYEYENHIIYTKKMSYSLIAAIVIYKIKFKNYLKSYKIVEKRTKIKAMLRKNKVELNKKFNYQIIKLKKYNTDNLLLLTYNDTSFGLITKPVYDYLFLQSTHIDSISIFEIENSKKYLIVGPKEIQKIIIKM